MANPDVQHGNQPATNPEVVVNGPLGETTVRVGGDYAAPTPDEPQQPAESPEEPAEQPSPAEPASEPTAPDSDSDSDSEEG